MIFDLPEWAAPSPQRVNISSLSSRQNFKNRNGAPICISSSYKMISHMPYLHYYFDTACTCCSTPPTFRLVAPLSSFVCLCAIYLGFDLFVLRPDISLLSLSITYRVTLALEVNLKSSLWLDLSACKIAIKKIKERNTGQSHVTSLLFLCHINGLLYKSLSYELLVCLRFLSFF